MRDRYFETLFGGKEYLADYAPMLWTISHRCDPKPRELADKHYNRQSVGSKNFVPPGRCLVLYCETATGKAFWVTSYPYPEYVKHEWAGALVCSAFRNEGAALSSFLIRQALQITRWKYPDIPDKGMITFVDPRHIKKKKDYGMCYKLAGFQRVGESKTKHLPCLQILPEKFPHARPPA